MWNLGKTHPATLMSWTEDHAGNPGISEIMNEPKHFKIILFEIKSSYCKL